MPLGVQLVRKTDHAQLLFGIEPSNFFDDLSRGHTKILTRRFDSSNEASAILSLVTSSLLPSSFLISSRCFRRKRLITCQPFQRFNASIRRWTNPPWRTIHLSAVVLTKAERFNASTLQQFKWDRLGDNDDNWHYTFGLEENSGWLGHNGQIPGYFTFEVYNPKLDATIVIAMNSDKKVNGEQGVNILLRDISKILFPDNPVNVPVIK